MVGVHVAVGFVFSFLSFGSFNHFAQDLQPSSLSVYATAGPRFVHFFEDQTVAISRWVTCWVSKKGHSRSFCSLFKSSMNLTHL